MLGVLASALLLGLSAVPETELPSVVVEGETVACIDGIASFHTDWCEMCPDRCAIFICLWGGGLTQDD